MADSKQKTTYVVRHGDDPQTDFFASFSHEETIKDNLQTIIPWAKKNGFLQDECSDTDPLYYKTQRLNPNLALKEQLPNLREYEILNLRSVSASLDLRIRFHPDHRGEMSENILVNPSNPLGEELSTFIKSLEERKYKFRRRHHRRPRFKDGTKTLNLNRALADQGYVSGFDARLVSPRLGWPPGRIAILVATISVFLIVTIFSIWLLAVARRPVDVTFVSEAECRVFVRGRAGADSLVVLSAGQSRTIPLKKGDYDVEVMPRDYPIIAYEARIRGFWLRKKTETLEFAERFDSKKRVVVLVNGYWEEREVANAIEGGLTINGYPRALDPYFTFSAEFMNGWYEMKYGGIPDAFFTKVEIPEALEAGLDRDKFKFGFENFRGDTARIIFLYDRP